MSSSKSNRPLLRSILRRLIPSGIQGKRHYMSVKDMAHYFLFQRILRINSEVPWPVHWSSIVVAPEKITLASNIRPPGLMPGTYIQAINGLRIGLNVWLAPGVKIVTANHDLCDYFVHPKCGPVEIGDNCWLGANSVILPHVKLGDHVVVAAGAVVTKSFSDDVLVAGVPARIIRKLEPYIKKVEACDDERPQ